MLSHRPALSSPDYRDTRACPHPQAPLSQPIHSAWGDSGSSSSVLGKAHVWVWGWGGGLKLERAEAVVGEGFRYKVTARTTSVHLVPQVDFRARG